MHPKPPQRGCRVGGPGACCVATMARASGAVSGRTRLQHGAALCDDVLEDLLANCPKIAADAAARTLVYRTILRDGDGNDGMNRVGPAGRGESRHETTVSSPTRRQPPVSRACRAWRDSTLCAASRASAILDSGVLTARGESLASHRDGRGAPPARRDDREYREYLREEQRSRRGCIARRMQPDFHHGLLTVPPAKPLFS
jgi:hypothetical protein